MAKRIKKINVTSDKKGTVKNPYTVEEHEQMLAEGQWTEDGFVEELGLVEGESTNPPMYDMYEFFEYDGEWPGGFVDGFGYVAPDVDVIGTYDPNYGVKIADGLTIDNAVKQSIFRLIDENEATSAVNKYIKFNRICGKVIGRYSLLLSVADIRKDPSMNNIIKALVTGAIYFSAPEIGIIYSFLDMNGNVDDVINYIINQIEAMYSR